MSIRNEINKGITRAKAISKSRCKKQKQRMLDQLSDNLQKKGEGVEDNRGLILRYQNAKPTGLTQMQQALSDAV